MDPRLFQVENWVSAIVHKMKKKKDKLSTLYLKALLSAGWGFTYRFAGEPGK
jgi:hypothetical protein